MKIKFFMRRKEKSNSVSPLTCPSFICQDDIASSLIKEWTKDGKLNQVNLEKKPRIYFWILGFLNDSELQKLIKK
jgi:hypothetical protein